MSAQLRQNQKDELKRELLGEIAPRLDRIVAAAAGNKSDREMVAAMTADNLSMSSKLEAVMAENQRFRKRIDAIEQNQDKNATEVKTEPGKTETELNSEGKACPVVRGKGPMSKYWFFEEKQYCANCKQMKTHLPKFCPELPERKKRKAEVLAKIAARK